jgi:putative ABC transport system permease protein
MIRDLRPAARALTRSPAFSILVVLTLALGIGASAAIFSVVRAVVLQPLDYPDPEQLVRITSELRGFGATDTGVSAAELFDYQSREDLFTGVAGVLPISANVTSGGTPERVEMLLVSWNYFAVLGVPAAHGRVFGREDDTPGVANVAVVSDAFWRRRLGAEPRAVGRTIVIDEDPIVIVGVMPPGFEHPGRTLRGSVDVWSPAGFRGEANAAPVRSRRRLEGALARLRPDTTLPLAQSRLADYGATARQQFPSDYPAQDGWVPHVVPLRDDVTGGVATAMFVLLCGVGLLLLVACVNVAHLILARSSARQQEIAVRRALGASAARLTSQIAAEAGLLVALSGILGVLVASWSLRALVALAPGRLPRLDEVRLDSASVLITALVSLVVTMVFALGPAWRLWSGDMYSILKDGGAGRTTAVRASRARSTLVAAEVALATILLVGAGLLVRTVTGLLSVPVGFETSRLLTARVTLPRPNDPDRATYLDPARRSAFYEEALRRITEVPGVEQAALASQIPLGGFNPPLFVEIDEQDAASAGGRPVVHYFQVSRTYFETLGVRILRGRAFSESDRALAEPVAIVSEAAARRLWGGRDPIGRRLRFSPDTPWMTVVGVAGDVLNRRLSEPPQPILYRPFEQSSDLTMGVLVRVRAGAAGVGEEIARQIRAVDPNVPIYSASTMDDLIDAAVAQRRFLMRVLAVFGSLAVALSLLGIYGVMAYSVSQRRREIGVRMAIGARPADIARMIVTSGLMLTAAGLIAGLVVAVALTQLLKSQLFGVTPSDPLTIASVLALMTLAAGAAAYFPARRAARVDPVSALRTQ